QCLTAADCAGDAAGPVCDRVRQHCRPCMAHAECPSGLCRYDEAIAAPVPVGGCLPPELVAWVDGSRCRPEEADGSAERPYCEVQDALAARFSFVAVRPRERSTPYAPISVSAGRVVIAGPERDADPQAVLGGVSVSGRSTQLLLLDLAVQNPTGTAALCREGQMSLLRSIVAFSREGVVATDGCRLGVERSRLSGNARVALRTTATARHRVINSLFVLNGRGYDTADRLNQADVVIDLGSNANDNLFSFNTASANEGFVSCRAGQVLRSSILAGRRSPLRDPGCVLEAVYVGDEETPRFDRRYALTPASHCCIDNALPDATVRLDYESSPRPKGAGHDMGCYELQ
ncbi:MAG: hypothetical protein NZ890_18435, partial [Myxococcota bacterium]|nr:hypothetical protein [Myxococcota bacterium]